MGRHIRACFCFTGQALFFTSLVGILTLVPFPSFADGAVPLQRPGTAEASMSAAGSGRIVLLHMYNGASFFQRLGALTGANKARYAARHGYDMVVRSPEGVKGLWKKRDCHVGEQEPCWEEDSTFTIDESRAATFGKLKLSLAACNNRDGAWLLWSDADALIVNQSIALDSIIDDAYDVALAYDWLMVQAGVILLKCSPFTKNFLQNIYDDRSFDSARALDQSALEAYINKLSPAEMDTHIKILPKHAINVYLEEYRAGDFLVHMAGKLYEATESGLWAIANQLDAFSMVADYEDIDAFMSTPYLLNEFSGVCNVKRGQKQASCPPEDPRRLRLKEPLGTMSSPNRYRHVALRYYFLPDWKDKYDVPGWEVKRRSLRKPQGEDPEREKSAHQVADAHPKSDVGSHEDGGTAHHNTPPHIEVPVDRFPVYRDAHGHGSGASAPAPNGRSSLVPRWAAGGLAVFLAILGFQHARRRRQRSSLKEH